MVFKHFKNGFKATWNFLKKIKNLMLNGWSAEFTEKIRKKLMMIVISMMVIIFVTAIAILLGVVIFYG